MKINITLYSDKDLKLSAIKLNKDYNYKYIKKYEENTISCVYMLSSRCNSSTITL